MRRFAEPHIPCLSVAFANDTKLQCCNSALFARNMNYNMLPAAAAAALLKNVENPEPAMTTRVMTIAKEDDIV